MKHLVALTMLFLVFGIVVQHLVSQPEDPKKLVCNEGKLLSQVTGQGSVYTRVNGLSCAYEKGILIISDNKSRVAINEYQ
ncbi:MAG: hypothetical protein ACO3SG_01560 [Methylophilaceae bacterium]